MKDLAGKPMNIIHPSDLVGKIETAGWTFEAEYNLDEKFNEW